MINLQDTDFLNYIIVKLHGNKFPTYIFIFDINIEEDFCLFLILSS